MVDHESKKIVKNFIDFFLQSNLADSFPWLVLGKGPTFSQHKNYDLTKYRTLSLNHALRELAVDVAHLIDIEVVADLDWLLDRNARYVVLPWFPHCQFKAGSKSLDHYLTEFPVLAKLASEERLLWYDLDTGGTRHGQHQPIVVSNFSSEAAVALLAQAGAKEVFTLGVDGGTTYDKTFADLQATTKFANGQLSFDSQFSQFASIIRQHDIKLAPLGVECPISIFIGASASEWLPAKVLEYSIARHSSITTKCHFLYQANIEIPKPKRSDCQGRTPFSFHRFLIPELKEFSGKAIYLDSDMLVTDDISQLWQLDLGPSDLLCAKADTDYQRQSQFAVMLLHCEKLDWRIADLIKLLDDGTMSYSDLLHDMKAVANYRAEIPITWNSLDLYEPGITSLVHFTDMTQQPWLSNHSPEEAIWLAYLKEAINDDFITLKQIQEQVNCGHIRPSLSRQLMTSSEGEAMTLPERMAVDLDFVPPHKLINSTSSIGQLTGKLLNMFKSQKNKP